MGTKVTYIIDTTTEVPNKFRVGVCEMTGNPLLSERNKHEKQWLFVIVEHELFVNLPLGQ